MIKYDKTYGLANFQQCQWLGRYLNRNMSNLTCEKQGKTRSDILVYVVSVFHTLDVAN